MRLLISNSPLSTVLEVLLLAQCVFDGVASMDAPPVDAFVPPLNWCNGLPLAVVLSMVPNFDAGIFYLFCSLQYSYVLFFFSD